MNYFRLIICAALVFACTVISAAAFLGSSMLIEGKVSGGGGGGGGTVNCTIGPPFQGSVPAAAAAAGFNTCAANYDFTQTGAFTDSLGPHTWSTLASWFACPDSGSANGFILYNTNNLNSGTQPCSDTAIITDNNGDPGASGGQVLRLIWTLADYNNNTQVTQISSTSSFNNPTPNGTTFPTGMYVQVTDRVTASTYNNTQNGGSGWLPYFSDIFWGSYGTPTCHTEYDFKEMYFPSTSTGGHALPTCGGPDPSGQIGNMAGYSNTVYSTLGFRISMNSSNVQEVCKFFNEAPITNGCATGTVNAGTVAQRNVLLLWSGPNRNTSGSTVNGANSCGGPCAPNVTNTELIQRVTFWSCSSWQTTACVTNNP